MFVGKLKSHLYLIYTHYELQLCFTLVVSSWVILSSSSALRGKLHSELTVRTVYPIWLFGCSQYWNFNSQTYEDIDILKVVSKAKFQKKWNCQTRFCCNYSVLFCGKNFDQQLKNIQNLVPDGKIWFGHWISFERTRSSWPQDGESWQIFGFHIR